MPARVRRGVITAPTRTGRMIVSKSLCLYPEYLDGLLLGDSGFSARVRRRELPAREDSQIIGLPEE
jgi:hypothetical protein